MNPVRKLALKAAETVVRQLSLRESTGWLTAGQLPDAGEVVTENSAMSLSTVWACVNLLSGTISSLPLMVYRTGSNGAREVAKDHPLYRLLHDSPNFDQTALDFWDFVSASIELQGNGFARVVREGAKIVSLVPVTADLVQVRRVSNGAIEYRWSEAGKSFVETERTMFHIRGPGGGPLGGMSTLRFGRQSFSAARAADKAAGKFFANGMHSSVAFTFEKWLTEEQRKIAKEELAEKYFGAVNAGRPVILEGGTTVSTLSINPEDAQMLATRAYSVQEICRFFGVPPFMVGHTEKSTSFGTGLEQQTLGFVKFALRRRLKRIEQAAEKQLLTPADRAAGITIEFSLEGLLRGDSAGRSTFYQSALTNGWMTINEVRALENMPPVTGGDVPRMQMQNVPITEKPGIAGPVTPPTEDEE